MKKNVKKNIFKILVKTIIIVLFSSACSDSIITNVPSVDQIEQPITISPTFSDIQNKIFNKSCAVSGCHDGSIYPTLKESAFNKIVNRQSSKGILLIKPNDPDNSYLLQKVSVNGKINGSRMPLNNPPLSKEAINAITEWINNGAKNN